MLEFIRETRRKGKKKRKYALYRCMECTEHREKEIRMDAVKYGTTLSCGCLCGRRKTHGMSNTVEYSAWCSMKNRCYYKGNIQYHNYGGRGIKVCPRWKNSFKNFFEDMGYKPSPELSVDRIDTNKDYYPENCQWGTVEEQQNNRRDCNIKEWKGKKQTITQWARELNINYMALYYRFKNGMSAEEAFTKPLDKSRTPENAKKETFNGKSQTLKEWSEELNISPGALRHRLYSLKWSVEKAFTTPVIQRKPKPALDLAPADVVE